MYRFIVEERSRSIQIQRDLYFLSRWHMDLWWPSCASSWNSLRHIPWDRWYSAWTHIPTGQRLRTSSTTATGDCKKMFDASSLETILLFFFLPFRADLTVRIFSSFPCGVWVMSLQYFSSRDAHRQALHFYRFHSIMATILLFLKLSQYPTNCYFIAIFITLSKFHERIRDTSMMLLATPM